MKMRDLRVDEYGYDTYSMNVEQVGDITATTLYRNGKIVLYEETTKVTKKIKNFGDFEFTKVLKRIHFDKNGEIKDI